jgi:hypothetical protein
MKQTLALLLTTALVVSPLPQVAAQSAEKVDYEAIYRIKDEGLNRSQVMDILSYLTDVHGPRLTGSSQMRAAQKYAQDKFKEWGLENVQLHSYSFGRGWQLKRFAAHMVAPTYAPLIAYPKAWTPGTPGVVRGEVMRVDIASEQDIEKYKGKLKNAFVFTQPAREVTAHFRPDGRRFSEEQLNELAMMPEPGRTPQFGPQPPPRQQLQGAPPQPQRGGFPGRGLQNRLNAFYVEEGVAAVVDAGRGDGGTIFVSSGGDRSATARPVPPQVSLAVEHYNRIVRMLDRKQKVELEVEIQTEFTNNDGPDALKDFNVLGEIPGTDPKLKDEVVMLGAHFDSWHSGTGATDNAAGSAVMMEVMRILKTTGLKPRRTIRIGLWSGEEQGLLGSRAYVNDTFASRPQPPADMDRQSPEFRKMMEAQPTLKPAHARFAGYFNVDNGTGKLRGVYLQGNEAVRPIFEAWLAPFKDLGATHLTIRNTGGTDHLSFDGVGLPGFQFIQDEVEYDTRTHHSNMDVYDRIQRGDMMQAVVIVASFVYHTAQRDEKLPRKPMRTPPAGPRASGSGAN